jgi:hypothetical protein
MSAGVLSGPQTNITWMLALCTGKRKGGSR